MNGFQKIIKYCAVAFAVFLCVVIFGSIAAAVFSVAVGVEGVSKSFDTRERISFSEQYSAEEIEKQGIDSIFVDCNAEVVVERGTMLSIEADNVTKDYAISCTNGVFRLVQDRPKVFFHLAFWDNDITSQERVVVTIPAEFHPERVTINSGSGKVFINELDTEKLLIDSGSGKVLAENVVSRDTELYTGSGSVRIDNSSLGRLMLDSGSGAVSMKNVVAEDARFDSGSGAISVSGSLTGRCEFESGSGSVSLSVNGKEENYRIEADCGSGSFRVNGKKREEGSYGNNVEGELIFDTGSGSVNVEFLTSAEE